MKSLSRVSRGEPEQREDELVEGEGTARLTEHRPVSRPEDTFEWLPPERVQYFAQARRSKLMARWIVGREPGVSHGDERVGWQQTYRAIFTCGLGEGPESGPTVQPNDRRGDPRRSGGNS